MKTMAPAAALVLGIVLMVASAVWPKLFPSTNSWTTEKSNQLSDLGSQTNMLKFQLVEAQNNPRMHSGRNAAEIKQEYEKVRAEYDQLHAEFEAARDRPANAAKALQWTGIALAAIGGVLVLIFRDDN